MYSLLSDRTQPCAEAALEPLHYLHDDLCAGKSSQTVSPVRRGGAWRHVTWGGRKRPVQVSDDYKHSHWAVAFGHITAVHVFESVRC